MGWDGMGYDRRVCRCERVGGWVGVGVGVGVGGYLVK